MFSFQFIFILTSATFIVSHPILGRLAESAFVDSRAALTPFNRATAFTPLPRPGPGRRPMTVRASIFEANGDLFGHERPVIVTRMKKGADKTVYKQNRDHLVAANTFMVQSGQLIELSIQDLREEEMILARIERTLAKQAEDAKKGIKDPIHKLWGGQMKPLTKKDLERQKLKVEQAKDVLQAAINTKEKAGALLEAADHLFAQVGDLIPSPAVADHAPVLPNLDRDTMLRNLEASWKKPSVPDHDQTA